jgi:hypothetical protein
VEVERVVGVFPIDNEYLFVHLAGFDLINRPGFGPVRLIIDGQRFDLNHTGSGMHGDVAVMKLEPPPGSVVTVAEVASAAGSRDDISLERDG